MIAPGFSVDCLETLEEIKMEGREEFKEMGGEKFEYMSCLNDSKRVNNNVRKNSEKRTVWMDIDIYKTAKALHIIFFTTWMAGLFYLPRLFVYHCKLSKNTGIQTICNNGKETIKVYHEPILILTWIIGTILVINIEPALWLNIKIICIVL